MQDLAAAELVGSDPGDSLPFVWQQECLLVTGPWWQLAVCLHAGWPVHIGFAVRHSDCQPFVLVG